MAPRKLPRLSWFTEYLRLTIRKMMAQGKPRKDLCSRKTPIPAKNQLQSIVAGLQGKDCAIPLFSEPLISDSMRALAVPLNRVWETAPPPQSTYTSA